MFEAGLALSSSNVISIVADFEDEFRIEIPDKNIGKFIAVKDTVKYLETRV